MKKMIGFSTAVVLLVASNAATADNVTLTHEQLKMGDVLVGAQWMSSKMTHDIKYNFTNITASQEVTATSLNLALAVGLTDKFSMYARLPVKDDSEFERRYSNPSIKPYTGTTSGVGDLNLGLQYRLSDHKDYGFLYAETKLDTAKSDSESPGTGAVDYTLGLGYNANLFPNTRQNLTASYEIKGHKESTDSGRDEVLVYFKSVGTGTGIRLVIEGGVGMALSGETGASTLPPVGMATLAAGFNFELQKGFEIEGMAALAYTTDIKFEDKDSSDVMTFQQSSLFQAFSIMVVKKF